MSCNRRSSKCAKYHLVPIREIEWCVHALFVKNFVLSNTNCLVDSHAQHGNLDIDLDGYIWAFSSLATKHFQIHCLGDTCVETPINP